MELHNELLQQAKDLAHNNANNPTQADLRRAVSAAYYALFHLLIFETCANWSRESSRKNLARMFQHSFMHKVSTRTADSVKMPFAREDPVVVGKLRSVAKTFFELQDKRHEADYDTKSSWTFVQAMNEILSVGRAFATWQEIKNEDIAQEYLVSLLIKPRD